MCLKKKNFSVCLRTFDFMYIKENTRIRASYRDVILHVYETILFHIRARKRIYEQRQVCI